MTMKFLSAWALLVAVAAAQNATYGTISGDEVRLYGGPGESNAILGQFRKDALVRMVAIEGRFLEVEVPGGFPVYVTTGTPERAYLREVSPGESVVTAKDLLIRAQASTEGGSLGRLQPGDRVIVVGEEGGFTRILAPDKVRGYIFDEHFAAAPDQATARVEFEKQHRVSRRALLESGPRSRILLEREEAQQKYDAMVASAFDRFDEESRKAWDQRNVDEVKTSLRRLVEELPEGHPSRPRAERMMVTVGEWDAARTELLATQKRLEEAKEESIAAERRYQESLTRIRTRATERAEANADPKSKYALTGRVGRSVPVGQQLLGAPAYAIWQGGKRAYYIESDRYDFSEYQDKLVGLVEVEGPMERVGLGFRVYRVIRMEILERHPDEDKLNR